MLPGHADCDGVPPAHAAEFSALLGGGPRDPGRTDPGVRHPGRRSCPGAGHYDVLAAPEFVAVVDGFLSGPVG